MNPKDYKETVYKIIGASDVATATIRWRNGTPVYQGFTKVDPGEGAVWGDLNTDGSVDVADVANIIDIMAGQ